MPASHPRSSSRASLDLAELSRELAQLDFSRPDKLGDHVIAVLARFFRTDRVSLALCSGRSHRMGRAFFTGFKVPLKQWGDCAKLINQVCVTHEPVLMPNVREHPELLSERCDSYRTEAFAIYPLLFQGKHEGVLCLSNLSTQQILMLENTDGLLSILLAQLAQIARLLNQAEGQPPAQSTQADELALIAKLQERLESTHDNGELVAVFAQVASELLPTEVIALIHDRINEPQAGVISIHKPVHLEELESTFASLAQQWQRRHRTAGTISLQDARLFGDEKVCREGSCMPEQRISATEVFPVFLDNDLYALVALGTTEAAIADRRRLSAFSVMAHALFSFVKKRQLLALSSELQTSDNLTGLLGERQFYQMLEREFDRASRYNLNLTLQFIDIDHFKDINEAYGFETGDQVLSDLSRIIVENMRSTDFVSRYSGERFVIVLPETPYHAAEVMAERLRRYVENHSFFIPNTNVFIKVTASIGVASHLDHKPASVAQFIEYADTALYFAKRNGRNKVVGYSYVINLMVGETKHKG